MNKLFLYLASLSFILLSCESDNDITYATPDYISGKWVFSKIGTINPQPVYSVIYQDYQNDASCDKDNLTLNPDTTFSSNDFAAQGLSCVNTSINGSYTLVNKDITLSYTQDNVPTIETYTITALTYTELTIVGNQNGTTTFYKLVRE